MSCIDEWDGPTIDEEIEDLENEGFVIFAPNRKTGRNSIEEAIDALLDLGYTVNEPEG